MSAPNRIATIRTKVKKKKSAPNYKIRSINLFRLT